jgi:pimeloyl-ACP methyl ester carboxylesterase
MRRNNGDTPTMQGHPLTGQFIFRYSDTVLINYETHGCGRRPMIFLHGFAAALTTWHDIIPFFPPEAATLYLVDLKGFGFSSKPDDNQYSVEEQAAIITAFLEHEALVGVVLVGHSLGGGIALLSYFAARTTAKGNLISRLILIACTAYPQRLLPIMRLLRNRRLGWGILHLLPLRLMVYYSLKRAVHDRRALTRERIARYMTCFGREGIAHVFSATCRQLIPERYAEYARLYREITVPTLIIWGRADRIIPPASGERLHNDIPGSRLLVIAGCGHLPQEERPAETYAAIRDFLAADRP